MPRTWETLAHFDLPPSDEPSLPAHQAARLAREGADARLLAPLVRSPRPRVRWAAIAVVPAVGLWQLEALAAVLHVLDALPLPGVAGELVAVGSLCALGARVAVAGWRWSR